MGKDKSADTAVKKDQALPAADQTTPMPVKKNRISGIIRFTAAALLILAAAFAAQLYLEQIIRQSESKTDTPAAAKIPVLSHRQTAPQTVETPAPVLVPAQPQEKITEIKYVIPESITNAINGLHDKVGKMETLTAQYMNIKADSSAVISLGERLDHVEKRTQKLAQISNDGALILTAALMIRENAAAGQPVRFEAEILKQLAASQPDLETPINYVYNNSSRQYPSNKILTDSFKNISSRIVYDLKHQGSWKERLLRKINEYVHISSPAADSPEDTEIKALEEIKNYVDEGQFAIAVEQLAKPENQSLLENQDLNQWFAVTDSKLKFNRALSQIAAYSLALMKSEGLKNVTLP